MAVCGRNIPNVLVRSPLDLPAVSVPLRGSERDRLHRSQGTQQAGLVELQNPAIFVVLPVGQVNIRLHDHEAHRESYVVHGPVRPAIGLVDERLVHDWLRTHVSDREGRRTVRRSLVTETYQAIKMNIRYKYGSTSSAILTC